MSLSPEARAEIERQDFFSWLKGQLKEYQEVFALSDQDFKDRKILEIGAGDRRLAASVIINKLVTDFYSLEPALGADDESGYASKDFLKPVMKKLPADTRAEIERKTIIAPAEAIPAENNSFDLVLGRSVPFENEQQLALRLRELLRVGKEIRIYPVTGDNRASYEAVVVAVRNEVACEIEFKTTLDTQVNTKNGLQAVKEDVLIIRKK